MKTKMPTLEQFRGLWDAVKKIPGITREIIQTLIDDGSFIKIIKERRDKILAEQENIRTFELTATVRQDRPYIEALEAAGPDAPSSYNSRKVGDLYTPVSDQEEKVDFILLNFPKGNGSWDEALARAKSKGYKITNPREACAVVEQHNLRKMIGLKYLYVVATTECSFEGYRQAVYVRVLGSHRSACLRGLEDFGDGSGWFLFRK